MITFIITLNDDDATAIQVEALSSTGTTVAAFTEDFDGTEYEIHFPNAEKLEQNRYSIHRIESVIGSANVVRRLADRSYPANTTVIKDFRNIVIVAP